MSERYDTTEADAHRLLFSNNRTERLAPVKTWKKKSWQSQTQAKEKPGMEEEKIVLSLGRDTEDQNWKDS